MATIYKRGKSYTLNWSADGNQHRRTLGKVSELKAQTELEIMEAALEANRVKLFTGGIIDDTPPIVFKDFMPDYLDWHKAEYPSSHFRVRQIAIEHLLPKFRTRPLDAISPREVERWKAARRISGAAPATIGKELRTLKAILNQAIKWEVISRHRIAVVSEPKNLIDRPPPYYTTDELARIYKAAAQHNAVWRFMANTGLRRAEMMKAKRGDIIEGKLRVLSNSTGRTKSARWRLIPLSPGALTALKKMDDDYLAPRINPRSLSRAFENDARKAKLDGSIHWLRHTFCSHLVMAGVDLRTVQELAGHASYQTTLNYSHLAASHLSDAVAGLEL